MTKAVTDAGYVCETRLSDRNCGKDAVHLEDLPRGRTIAAYICIGHLAEAIRDGRVQLFLPDEIEAAKDKAEGVLDRINDIESNCSECGKRLDGDSPEPDLAFEVSW